MGSIMKEIFSSYSNTYPFNYLFGDKELLARQVGAVGPLNLLKVYTSLRQCTFLFYSQRIHVMILVSVFDLCPGGEKGWI